VICYGHCLSVSVFLAQASCRLNSVTRAGDNFTFSVDSLNDRKIIRSSSLCTRDNMTYTLLWLLPLPARSTIAFCSVHLWHLKSVKANAGVRGTFTVARA